MSWVPSNDFENEVVSQQPDHNFIFGTLADSDSEEYYPRPESHVQYALEKRQRATTCLNPTLDIIGKVQRIAGTKPLGQQPTIHDWDNNNNLELETIKMMRHVGIGSSIDQPLDASCTVATLPITQEMHVMHNGKKRMPIFYDDKFFKLKPRISNESPTDLFDEDDSLASSQNKSFSSSVSTSTDVSINVEKPSSTAANESSTQKSRESTESGSYKTAYSREAARRSSVGGDGLKSSKGSQKNRMTDNWRARSPLNNNRQVENWRVRNSIESNHNDDSDSFNNSLVEFPPLPSKPRRDPVSDRQNKPDRFYTAKELYKKNRRN